MEDIERDTLAFDRVRDDDPDARVLPGAEGWGSAGDDGATRRTVTLEGRASRVGWYVAAGLLGVIGLAVIVIALPLPSSQLAKRPAQSHQRVTIPPARRSPHRSHHQTGLAREPKRQSPPRRVPRRGVIHRRAAVPVVPAPSPTPTVVAVSPPAPPAASAQVQEQKQPRAPRRRGGGQFSYLGG